MKVAVVGGGPAGMMAAGIAAEKADVTLLERNEKTGKKLYITGKGRCNVTNAVSPREFLDSVVTNPKFLTGAISRFSPDDTIEFMERNGCPVKTERGGRVFPVSDHASDVTRALMKPLGGVRFRYGETVRAIERDADGLEVVSSSGTERFDRVILACGGKSYPVTGSTGEGYLLAQRLGHTVMPPRPALVPVRLKETVKPLEGLSLKNVAVTLESGGFRRSLFGEMLFTASGVSGPVILSLSSLYSAAGVSGGKLTIDFKPALDDETLERRILSDFKTYSNKQLKNALFDLLPRRLIPFLIGYAHLPGDKPVNLVTKTERAALYNAVRSLTFTVDGLYPVEAGIVTGGGVSVAEVSPKTMESKLVRGLYFAGEMLDVDALTGGFNIQIALSTGYAAGLGAREETSN